MLHGLRYYISGSLCRTPCNFCVALMFGDRTLARVVALLACTMMPPCARCEIHIREWYLCTGLIRWHPCMDCDVAAGSGVERCSEDGSEPVSSDIERSDEGIAPPVLGMTDDEEHGEEHDMLAQVDQSAPATPAPVTPAPLPRRVRSRTPRRRRPLRPRRSASASTQNASRSPPPLRRAAGPLRGAAGDV